MLITKWSAWRLVPHSLHEVITMPDRTKWATSWQNQQNVMCAQWRLRSACASAQSGQSSLCTQWVAKDPSFLHTDSEDWADWVDAQADLSLPWAHMPFCWFCHGLAQININHEIWVKALWPVTTKPYKNGTSSEIKLGSLWPQEDEGLQTK